MIVEGRERLTEQEQRGREKGRDGTEKEDGRVNNLYKGILGVGIKGIK